MMLRRMLPEPNLGMLRRDFDRVFGDLFDGFERPWGRAGEFPPLNVWEDGERLIVEAEAPGLSMSDLAVEIMGNELTIKGRRPAAPEREEAAYHRRERGAGEFGRRIALPVEIDADRVEATMKNGVLTIVLPKAESAKPRKIEVRTA